MVSTVATFTTDTIKDKTTPYVLVCYLLGFIQLCSTDITQPAFVYLAEIHMKRLGI